jgi:hypothetical protein
MSFDLFGEVPVPVDPTAARRDQHTAAIAALPEKLRPRAEAIGAIPTTKPQLDEWTRTTQRKFLLWMIGALARGMYTASSMTSLPGVLQKLNGLGGEW